MEVQEQKIVIMEPQQMMEVLYSVDLQVGEAMETVSPSTTKAGS